MNEGLRGLDFVYIYIDDMLIVSTSQEQHVQHFCLVLERLDTNGILINVDKSRFGVPELDILGYHLYATGICPLQEKVQSVREVPLPTYTYYIYRKFAFSTQRVSRSDTPDESHLPAN